MKNRYLFFDMDDTLVKCSGYFYDVEEIVAKKFSEFNKEYSVEEIRKKFNDRQIENIEEHGYGPDNFKYSLMQVGSEIVGYDFFKYDLAGFISQTAQRLYDSPLELLDGVEDTIKYLYEKGYEMYIITKGSKEVQTDRFNRLPIRSYFKKYYVVKHKLKKDYEEIIELHKFNPIDCFMIGNSPKGDINEAKLAGLNTIYVPNEYTWQPEEEQIIEIEPVTYRAQKFSDIKSIL